MDGKEEGSWRGDWEERMEGKLCLEYKIKITAKKKRYLPDAVGI